MSTIFSKYIRDANEHPVGANDQTEDYLKQTEVVLEHLEDYLEQTEDFFGQTEDYLEHLEVVLKQTEDFLR